MFAVGQRFAHLGVKHNGSCVVVQYEVIGFSTSYGYHACIMFRQSVGCVLMLQVQHSGVLSNLGVSERVHSVSGMSQT